ncbi:MAG: ABC transporter substrate-binding protein, partial [Pseudomonadota bacterium]
IDLIRETNPKRWRAGYTGPAFDTGELVQTTLKYTDTVTIPALVFNLRRSPANNIAVRKALQLMYDVDWVLETQGNVAQAALSFYGDTRLAAQELPSAIEIDLLSSHEDSLPDGIFTKAAPDLVVVNSSLRDRRRRAIDMLEREGFFIRDGHMIDPDTDAPLRLELVTSDAILLQDLAPFQTWLRSIGITLDFSVLDATALREVFQNGQDFDITTVRWHAFDPPGRNEDFFLHSRHASTGFGVTGLESPVADALIETMLQSRDEDQIIAAARAFDRYLRWNVYVLPIWQQD